MTHRVTLLTHRLATDRPTGVGRYRTELLTSLARVADPSEWHWTAASPSEPAPPTWLPAGVGHATVPGPRRGLHTALALGLPLTLDRWLDRPDLVHALQPWVPLPTRAPRVVTVHDLLPLERPDWYPWFQRWWFGRGIRDAVGRASRLVCVSAHVADRLVERFGLDRSRVSVVHSAVDDRFRRAPGAEAVARCCERYGLEPGRYLLALGVMSARENPSTVVSALARLDPRLLGARGLVLTGPDRHGAARVRQVIEEAGLGDRVLLAGFVPDADLVPLLAGALALTHPARDEGFGLTPLEAMAVGTPVIASSAGSLPEVTGDAALLVDPADPAAWAEAVHAVATDPDRRDRLVRLGDAHQRSFTWERTAEATLDVYRAVLAG